MVLATVPSMTSKGKWYAVIQGKDGKVFCTCPAWRFSKADEKGCKHLKNLAAKLVAN
jgi:predicted nucleic acid-binding Zn finger protein